MTQVLVLTESPTNELIIYNKLQKLDFEILLSDKILNSFRRGENIDEWFKVFPVVIISETICDKEAKKFAELTNHSKTICLRKYIENITLKEKKQNLPFDDYILAEASLIELRDKLFWIKERITHPKSIAHQKNEYIRSSLDIFIDKLSPISRKIFIALEEQAGAVISRESLSNIIWGKTNKSTLCQLSNRIRSLRQAIFETFGFKNAIVTIWCNGYSLSKDFYKKILLEDLSPLS